jgi:hypothetical protein
MQETKHEWNSPLPHSVSKENELIFPFVVQFSDVEGDNEDGEIRLHPVCIFVKVAETIVALLLLPCPNTDSGSAGRNAPFGKKERPFWEKGTPLLGKRDAPFRKKGRPF